MSAMDELDFSGLSDDQLVELAIAIAKEAARRNPALQAAFAEALATERRRSMLAFGAPNGPANMKFNKPSE